MSLKYLSALFFLCLSTVCFARPFPLELVGSDRQLAIHVTPAVSPDGRWLVYGVDEPRPERALRNGVQYARSWAPQGCQGTRLRVLALRSREEFSLGSESEPAIRPAWSPSGTQIAYYAQRGDAMRHVVSAWPPATSTTFDQIPIHPRRWTGDEPIWIEENRVVVPAVRAEDVDLLERMDRTPSTVGEPRVQRTGPSDKETTHRSAPQASLETPPPS